MSPESLALVGSLVTGAATLGGVALGSRLHYGLEERRELRATRRLTYIKFRWLQFAENLGTWAFEPGSDFGNWVKQLQDAKVELDLVASKSVSVAVQDYIDHLPDALAAIEDPQAIPSVMTDPHEEASRVGRAFGQAMGEKRRAVLGAMRRDTGIRD